MLVNVDSVDEFIVRKHKIDDSLTIHCYNKT